MPTDRVTSKEDILGILRNDSSQLRTFGVRRIGLFGSFVHGTQVDSSDVDLFVEFEPSKKTFDNFMGLSFHLEDRLGRRVEVVTSESLSPYIGPHILKEIEYVTLAA